MTNDIHDILPEKCEKKLWCFLILIPNRSRIKNNKSGRQPNLSAKVSARHIILRVE